MTESSHQRIVSNEVAHHQSPIPLGVIGNGLIFLSAVRGVHPETSTLADGAEAQLQQAFKNMSTTLAAAGVTAREVLRVGVYAKDLASLRGPLDAVWVETFGDDPPARFAIGVNDIGRTGDGTEILLEVIALAAAGSAS